MRNIFTLVLRLLVVVLCSEIGTTTMEGVVNSNVEP